MRYNLFLKCQDSCTWKLFYYFSLIQLSKRTLALKLFLFPMLGILNFLISILLCQQNLLFKIRNTKVKKKTLAGSDSIAYASPIILKSLSASLRTSSAISFHIPSSPLSPLIKNWPAYKVGSSVKKDDDVKEFELMENEVPCQDDA